MELSQEDNTPKVTTTTDFAVEEDASSSVGSQQPHPLVQSFRQTDVDSSRDEVDTPPGNNDSIDEVNDSFPVQLFNPPL